MVCLVRVAGFPGSERPTPVITTSSSIDSPVWVGAASLSAGVWDFSIWTELAGGSAEAGVLTSPSSGITRLAKEDRWGYLQK